jgi:hypothetical protein
MKNIKKSIAKMEKKKNKCQMSHVSKFIVIKLYKMQNSFHKAEAIAGGEVRVSPTACRI